MQKGDILNYTYQLIEPIGKGGLGSIWLAYHTNLRKYVVVKKVHDRFTTLVNCRIEVDILKSLRHQYLPVVYDFLENQEGIFTVMDYIAGQDLQHYLDSGYVFSEEQLLYWLRQLADVLSYLHSRRIIHCDIKPGNIMITETGDVCLIDFNISLDGENSKDLVGVSSRYAAPEQIQSAQNKLRGIQDHEVTVNEKSDLYSLGAVFYRLMSGQMPGMRREDGWTLKALQVPYSSSLINIVDQLMEDNVSRRIQSADQLLEKLDHLDRQSDEYKKKVKLWSTIGIIVSALIIILTSVLIVTGHQRREKEFFQAYDAYMERAGDMALLAGDDDALEDLVTDGRKLLNESDYQDDFKKYSEQKARVLLAVGQGELLLDHDTSALSYLESAVKLSDKDASIYRDLAIASARTGDMDQADDYLWQAISHGLDEADSLLVEAEFLTEEKDLAGAYEKAKQAATNKNASDDVMRRAAILAVQLADSLGRYQDGIEFCRTMSKKTFGAASALWLRQAGVLAAKGNKAGQLADLSSGILAYQDLLKTGYVGYTDYINLSYLQEAAGDLAGCKKTLLEAAEDYSDEYEVFLQLSYISYQIARDTPVSNRDYSDTRTYYEKARELYEARGLNVSENADLLSMEQIIKELIIGGWLKP